MAQKIRRRTREQVRKLWIKALESDEYLQNTASLRTDTGYCCLGVLCDLARRDGGDRWKLKQGDWYYKNTESYLPGVIATFIGLPHSKQEQLVVLNDEKEWDFRDIAKVLRLHFAGVDFDQAIEKIRDARTPK